MVDFRKKLGAKEIIAKENPLEIYEDLDRRSVAGPLRPAQEHAVKDWFSNKKNQRDLIIKLHTGEGKTLIGLLILQSKINSGDGPCLYVCPNKYLVEQTCLEAKKFGIQFCIVDNSSIPDEFLDGKKILITHVQKVFNGRSIFGLNNNSVQVNAFILDDSHACIDSLKQSFSIQINNKNKLYGRIKTLFDDDVRNQGEGTLLDIENGNFESLIPVPYWSLLDKKSELIEILSQHTDDNELVFTWPLLKNSLENYQVLISSETIELAPYLIPMHHFGSFNNASQRILMSATTQDDSFFIKGLGLDSMAVKNPIINPRQKWSGEKMILIPSLISENLDRELIVSTFAKPFKKNYGLVALTSSYRKASQYEGIGSIVAKSEHIFKAVNALKNRSYEKTIVFVNRYDGIDLPDESCRVLILDSKPFFNSLYERYEEECRQTSDITNIKIAQKVEQALGRSVRGEKDYSIILIIGTDLVKFIKSSATNKYFSSQTRKQIEIGLEIARMGESDVEDGTEGSRVLNDLMSQCLKRNDSWKEFYKEEMDSINSEVEKPNLHSILEIERNAEESNFRGNHEKACELIQKIIDEHCDDKTEKGWYLQYLARYKYLLSKIESNAIQKSAFEHNWQLLKPKDGITYKKLEFINENQIRRIKDFLSKFSSYEDLMLNIDDLLNNLSFGMPSEKFESSLRDMGALLGFLSQRPDKEFKKGPDNLWCGVGDKYLLFECKSEVDIKRDDISKYEAGQMNTHCAWFKDEYGDKAFKPILIIPTKNLSYHANFSENVGIMRKSKLKLLKGNILSFIKELKVYNINEVSDERLNELLILHKLDLQSLCEIYTEEYYHKKN